jgi:hypothetical protein
LEDDQGPNEPDYKGLQQELYDKQPPVPAPLGVNELDDQRVRNLG